MRKKIKLSEDTVTLTAVREREAAAPRWPQTYWNSFFDQGLALRAVIFLLGMCSGFVLFYLKYKTN